MPRLPWHRRQNKERELKAAEHCLRRSRNVRHHAEVRRRARVQRSDNGFARLGGRREGNDVELTVTRPDLMSQHIA